MELKNKLFFKKVNNKDALILYDLLKTRKHNISHEVLPNFQTHKQFVENNPYLYWYIIYLDEKAIGTFYIKSDNSIGIKISLQNHNIIKYILDFISSNFKPQDSIPSEIPPYFYFNLSCDNKELKDCFQSLNLKPFQISYKF